MTPSPGPAFAEFLTSPLELPPALFALALFALTPGMHVLLSVVLEHRAVRWRDDYPAILVGDPLLALAGGLSALAWADIGPAAWARTEAFVIVTVSGGILFGLLQSQREVRSGRYLPVQAHSPTKLWHQYVVYPLMGTWCTGAVVPALGRWSENPLLCTLIAASVLTWAALTVSCVWDRRLGHGGFDWRSGRAVTVVFVDGAPRVDVAGH